MATTQASLNDYFKTRRSARDGLSVKKGQGLEISLKSNETIKQLSDALVNKVETKEEFCVPEVSLFECKQIVKSKTLRKTKAATRSKLPSATTENILAAFQRATAKKIENSSNKEQQGTESELLSSRSSKRGRDAIESQEVENTATDLDNATALQISKNDSTPVKNEGTELRQHKRSKQLSENTAAETRWTPDSKTGSSNNKNNRARRGSARKKLQLDQHDQSTPAEENIVLKSSGGSELQLKKCSKLSELRAQLLRLKDCDNKLQQFRSSVRQATQEADAAAALVIKSKGGLPDTNALSSPLKAASPRKLYSPHKVRASPYKAPVAASPRQKPPHPQLQLFKSLDVEVPVSPVKTPTKSPGKASSSNKSAAVPAYLRYQHLVQDTPPSATASVAADSSELSLPYPYRVVREVFRAVDTVVSLMHNRQEVITFSKLRPAVQQMIRRTFYERNLGQLSRVFPLGYIFRRDKIRPGAAITASGTPNKSGYQLTIAANLDYKNALSGVSGSSKSAAVNTKVNLLSRFESSNSSPSAPATSANPTSTAVTVVNSSNTATYRKMDSVVMVERRALFHKSLIETLHQHHARYLESLEPSVLVTDYSTIKRWHPSFPLDDVPDIEPAALPQPPQQKTYCNAADVLAAARSLFSVNPRLEAAMESAAEKSKASEQLQDANATGASVENCKVKPTTTPTATAAQNPDVALALKGISVSLLAKIRAREAAAASRAMVRSASENNELAQLSRLPEMARILRHTLVAERRAALHWDAAIATLKESHSGKLGPGEMDEHLELLIKHLPDWITKHKLSSGVFVKINKSTDINNISEKLRNLIKQKS